MTDPRLAELEARVADLSRGLAFYRLVSLGLLGTVGYVAWQLTVAPDPTSPWGAPGEVWAVDLAERLAYTNANQGRAADVSETYYKSPTASVHMHFMGFGQTTPLHLHPEGSEVVIIAGSTADVTHLWGGPDGGPASRRGPHPTHSLIASPPLTGHEWYNPAPDTFLANLVFMAPLFAGNLYVKPDDARLLQGPEPTVLRLDDIDAFAAAGEGSRLTPLPVMEGRFYQLFVADTHALPANPGKPVIGYVAAGRGAVDGHPVKPQMLVHVESGATVTVQADRGAPLSLALFDPHGALAGAVAAAP